MIKIKKEVTSLLLLSVKTGSEMILSFFFYLKIPDYLRDFLKAFIAMSHLSSNIMSNALRDNVKVYSRTETIHSHAQLRLLSPFLVDNFR